MSDKFKDINEYEFQTEDDDILSKSMELIDAGFDQDYVDEWIQHENLASEEKIAEDVQSEGLVESISNAEFERRYEMMKKQSNAVFEEKPKKPEHFKKVFKQFKPKFQLKSGKKYVINGTERSVKKLNFNQTLRLVSKFPSWANYIGHNLPEMLIDEVTGQYRFTKTIMTLLERTFEGYDLVNGRPSDFLLDVVAEISLLLDIDEDELLSADPDEVVNAIGKFIEVNQRFFLRVWNKSGPLKELFNLTSGKLTEWIEKMKEEQNQNEEEESDASKSE